MMGGAVLAAAASSGRRVWRRRCRCCSSSAGITGVGEAALFVGAITLIADLSPPDRRAEGASYFSIAVFGGLGIGPVLGEWVLDDVNYEQAFLTAGALALATAVLASFVPSVGGSRRTTPTTTDAIVAAARGSCTRLRSGPASCWRSIVAAFSTFTAFIPEHARTVGLSGAGGLFLVYSARLPRRTGGRRQGARPHRSRARRQHRTRVRRRLAVAARRPVPHAVGAVGRGGRVRDRHGVQLPVADGDRRQPRRRARARRRR